MSSLPLPLLFPLFFPSLHLNSLLLCFLPTLPPYFRMQVRPAQLEEALQIAEIHVASWQTAFRGIMLDSYLDQQSVEQRKKGWEENILKYPGNLRVAVDERGEIQGFACSGRGLSTQFEGYNGEIYGIHVNPGIFKRFYDIVLFIKLTSVVFIISKKTQWLGIYANASFF